MKTKLPSTRHQKGINSRTGKTKVKSGCRTCKIRKVKCDEGQPACHKCLSTGRVCDGYGIWGGGGNAYGSRPPRPKACDAIQNWKLVTITTMSIDEQGCFEWFTHRSARKLPGPFISTFWSTLILQATQSEPAVLHAALALTSTHKSEINESACPRERTSLFYKHGLDTQEKFTLQQYSKAIGYLKPHFSANNKESSRVALIACVLFTCLEFLSGHYQTGIAHLQNGLKLLSEMNSADEDRLLILNASCDPVDERVVETFLRLSVQAQLFGQGSRNRYLSLSACKTELRPRTFNSPNEARHALDRSLHRIFCLAEHSRWLKNSWGAETTPELVERQQCVQADLASWLCTYNASSIQQQSHWTVVDIFAYQILRSYHTMASIMASVCLCPSNEMIYDSHTPAFISIMMHWIRLRKMTLSPSFVESLAAEHAGMSNSITDMGWLPKLYFTAIKCRNHRVRLQAIRLMESSPHKEGIWDAILIACIAREVMMIEEGEFYDSKGSCFDDDFGIFDDLRKEDLELPVLPESYRVYGMRVVLPNDALEKVQLIYRRRRRQNGGWQEFVRDYDPLSGRWTDGGESRVSDI